MRGGVYDAHCHVFTDKSLVVTNNSMAEVRNIEADLQKVESILGHTFNDKAHLRSAITHRSYLNEHREADWDHNERLEFLGDAVLELVVTHFLFEKYPEKPEGELTAVRAALVNTVSLSAASEALQINDYLLLSKGESKDTGRARSYILANAFEAFVGAMYMDAGYDAAKTFIANNLFAKTENIVEKRLWQDPKSRFQELAQEHNSVTPVYDTLASEGPDHDRVFTIGVFLNKVKVAEGSGRSKQEAEQAAAEAAIVAKGW